MQQSTQPDSSPGKATAHRVAHADPQLVVLSVKSSATLLCYLCAQPIPSESLLTHQSQCYVKVLLQWERTPAETRGPKPRPPEESSELFPVPQLPAPDETEAANPVATTSPITSSPVIIQQRFQEERLKTKKALVPCEYCGRKFLPDRLIVHNRGCRPGATAKPVRVSASSRARHLVKEAEVKLASAAVPAAEAQLNSDADDDDEFQIKDEQEDENQVTGTTPTDNDNSNVTATAAVASRGPNVPPLSLTPHESRKELAEPPSPPMEEEDPFSEDPEQQWEKKPTLVHSSAVVQSLDASNSPQLDLHKCAFCGRSFAPDRIEYHESVCIGRHTVQLTPRRTTRSNSESLNVSKSSASPQISSVKRSSEDHTLSKDLGAGVSKSQSRPMFRQSSGPITLKSGSFGHGSPQALTSTSIIGKLSHAAYGVGVTASKPFSGYDRSRGAVTPRERTLTPQARDVRFVQDKAQQQKLCELESSLKRYDERATHRFRDRTARTPPSHNLMDFDKAPSPESFQPFTAMMPALNLAQVGVSPNPRPEPPGEQSVTMPPQEKSSPLTPPAAPGSNGKRKSLAFCPDCGTKLLIRAQRFCHDCGTNLTTLHEFFGSNTGGKT